MDNWEAGAQVGPYTLVDRLGAGGMGEVWKARDTRLDRTVALKRLAAAHAGRFAEEARAIAALNHPNICQIYDIGPDYLVLEYVAGQPLRGPLPLNDAVALALQLAAALDESHTRGILHRDLKPANVIVTAQGSAKLLDFGIAKLLRESSQEATQTIEGTVIGTAAYMAPEQAEGKPVDARTDVFSFGTLLYEMLSGRRAFPGESLAAVLSAVLRDQPPPLDVPASMAEILQRCLAKNPSGRFQSMRELRAALEAVSVQPHAPRPSIAVLPFANLSPDKDNDYFSDGLTEEIIGALAQNADWKVIARTSAFAFRGKEQDIRKIAAALGVAHVVEGSVRKAGSRIRVTAQLIAAADGSHVWSQRYDRDLEDVFAVQDELAAAIAGALQGKLIAPSAAVRRHTPKLPAYEAYLKARFHQWRLTREAVALAEENYQLAIRLDPAFALAHVGYADLVLLRAVLGIVPMAHSAPPCRAAAEEALRIDPKLSEAHAMLGILAANLDYDWTRAEAHFARAIAHQPVPAIVRCWYAFFFLLRVGRLTEGEEQIRRAIGEDPLNSSYRIAMACLLIAKGGDREAEFIARQTLEVDPGMFMAEVLLGSLDAANGDTRGAAERAERVLRMAPWHLGSMGFLAAMRHLNGDEAEAKKLLAAVDLETYGAPLALLGYHHYCGHADDVAHWFAKAIDERHPGVWATLALPMGRSLRTSRHWPSLAQKLNLTPAMAAAWSAAGLNAPNKASV